MVAAPAARPAFLDAILALPRPLLLGFDVDGTLAPIVRVPSRAKVPARVVHRLRTLSSMPGLHLAVVTGREPEALARILPLEFLYRGVLHGKQVMRPGEPAGALKLTVKQRRALRDFGAFAQSELSARGVTLEDKPGAWGVHVRALAERDPVAAKRTLARARERAAELGLEVRDGRAIVEVEARSGDKGEALRRIHKLSRARSVVFLGDDVTDLPALRYATAHGMGLFVRSVERKRRPPGVTGSLRDVGEVHALVAALADALSAG